MQYITHIGNFAGFNHKFNTNILPGKLPYSSIGYSYRHLNDISTSDVNYYFGRYDMEVELRDTNDGRSEIVIDLSTYKYAGQSEVFRVQQGRDQVTRVGRIIGFNFRWEGDPGDEVTRVLANALNFVFKSGVTYAIEFRNYKKTSGGGSYQNYLYVDRVRVGEGDEYNAGVLIVGAATIEKANPGKYVISDVFARVFDGGTNPNTEWGTIPFIAPLTVKHYLPVEVLNADELDIVDDAIPPNKVTDVTPLQAISSNYNPDNSQERRFLVVDSTKSKPVLKFDVPQGTFSGFSVTLIGKRGGNMIGNIDAKLSMDGQTTDTTVVTTRSPSSSYYSENHITLTRAAVVTSEQIANMTVTVEATRI